MKCIYCGSDQVNEDELEINGKDWPIWFCDNCDQIFHREVDE